MSDIHAVAHSYETERIRQNLDRQRQEYIKDLDDIRRLHECHISVLMEEVDKWKSHRQWSDRILKAYLDLECLST